MSQITEALNKVQKSREDHLDQRIPDFVYVKETHRINFKILVLGLIVVGIAAVALISNEFNNLRNDIKKQEKEINDLNTYLVSVKDFSDNQRESFNFRLRNEIENRKIQITNLNLIDNTYYINLIRSINASSRRINYLEDSVEKLKGEVQKNPVPAIPKSS